MERRVAFGQAVAAGLNGLAMWQGLSNNNLTPLRLMSERSMRSYRVSRAKIRVTFRAIVTSLHSPRT
jgi:hypothetical protein